MPGGPKDATGTRRTRLPQPAAVAAAGRSPRGQRTASKATWPLAAIGLLSTIDLLVQFTYFSAIPVFGSISPSRASAGAALPRLSRALARGTTSRQREMPRQQRGSVKWPGPGFQAGSGAMACDVAVPLHGLRPAAGGCVEGVGCMWRSGREVSCAWCVNFGSAGTTTTACRTTPTARRKRTKRRRRRGPLALSQGLGLALCERSGASSRYDENSDSDDKPKKPKKPNNDSDSEEERKKKKKKKYDDGTLCPPASQRPTPVTLLPTSLPLPLAYQRPPTRQIPTTVVTGRRRRRGRTTPTLTTIGGAPRICPSNAFSHPAFPSPVGRSPASSSPATPSRVAVSPAAPSPGTPLPPPCQAGQEGATRWRT